MGLPFLFANPLREHPHVYTMHINFVRRLKSGSTVAKYLRSTQERETLRLKGCRAPIQSGKNELIDNY